MMKKILSLMVIFLLGVSGFVNCTSHNEEKKLDIEQKESANYNVTSATAEAGALDYTNEDFPTMIVTPISPSKANEIARSPVTEKRAAWNAALTALKASLPSPEDMIIFDWSKTEMQINNANECRFMGDIEAKNAKGEYVSYFMNIGVTYENGDPSKPSSWKANVVLVE